MCPLFTCWILEDSEFEILDSNFMDSFFSVYFCEFLLLTFGPDSLFSIIRATNKVTSRLVHKCRPFLGHLNLRGCYHLTRDSLKIISKFVIIYTPIQLTSMLSQSRPCHLTCFWASFLTFFSCQCLSKDFKIPSISHKTPITFL
jgi:hypothetical protein